MNQLLLHASLGRAGWGDALLKAQQWSMKKGSTYDMDLGVTEQLFGDPAMPVLSNP